MSVTVFVAMKAHSQRCPGKNIKLFDVQLGLLKQIERQEDLDLVICTDCPEIQAKSTREGFRWIDRPKYTTWQGGGSFKVQLYAVDILALDDNDIFIDLNICHVGANLNQIMTLAELSDEMNTTVISMEISKVPPQKQFFIKDGKLVPCMGFEMTQYQMTTQLLEPAYVPSGINAIPAWQMKKYGSIYNPEAFPWQVDPTDDVDYIEDLANVLTK